MKKFLTISSLLFLLAVNDNSLLASDAAVENNSATTFKIGSYMPGLLVIRVKSEFRSRCTLNDVSLPGLKAALSEISASVISKKFPLSHPPHETINKYGQKLVDLSLIYEVQFSPVVKIEEAIRLLKLTGVVDYAEPLYIHNADYIPNDPSVASQYAIAKISAYTAWDICKGDTNVVIGIVDSGTDWDHPDLQANIKYNYNDPVDGLDNDTDGFTDNFRGWDVSENDNNPMVGASLHGSHVSGCADAVTDNSTGVASPAYNCKFLPVKSTHDTSGNSIDNGYDGIVYAADHGANVINCSWGRTGYTSQMEQDIINYATFNKDALVVAAAGNNIYDVLHYPSSYENVISVAATRSTDAKANFSNYNSMVDVCAPGEGILSTYYNNTYASLDGTSMASPIAAGCAAMIKAKFPSLNALQVGEQLRSTCDNIYGISGNGALLNGKLGKGRVNLFKAVSDSISPGVILKDHHVTDGHNDIFVTGDTLRISTLLENLLRPTTNLVCSLSTTSTDVQIIMNNFNPGVLNTFDTISNYALPFLVTISASALLNTDVTFKITLTDGTWSDLYLFKVTVNVDYINITVNQVSTSITSKSTIGYNQPGQTQGLGFTYKGSPTILYDMGLMIGAQGTQVSDNIRSTTGNTDDDFLSSVNVTSLEPGLVSDFDVTGVFKDNGTTSFNPLNLEVTHNEYAWIASPDNNYVMVQYFIKNNGTVTLNNLFAGLFADWDIPAYADNKCSTDIARRMGYVWSTDTNGLFGGIKLLSHTAAFSHYALDDTAVGGAIQMYDDFNNAEKYLALSTSNANAGTAHVKGNDVRSVVSSGGFNLLPGSSVEVTFALLAGENLDSIQVAADAAQVKYDQIFNGILPVGNAGTNQLYQGFPNPADKEVRIEFSLINGSYSELCIYNLVGEKVKTVIAEKLTSGSYSMVVNLSDLPSGNYLYRLISGSFTRTLPLSIVHQ